jgi:hypothetical protein
MVFGLANCRSLAEPYLGFVLPRRFYHSLRESHSIFVYGFKNLEAHYHVILPQDRPNPSDWIKGGRIDFDDGSSLPITQLNNDGTATIFNLTAPVNISSLLFTVTSTGPSSGNIGLSEIVVSYSQPQTPVPRADWVDPLPLAGAKPAFDTTRDLARNATALSSTSSLNQGPNKAIDGILGGYTAQGGVASEEWATAGEKSGAWIKLTWPYPITVNQVVLYVSLFTLFGSHPLDTLTVVCRTDPTWPIKSSERLFDSPVVRSSVLVLSSTTVQLQRFLSQGSILR